ncbi:recombinase family protein [Treponema pectinovorum]|uniref:recombinase family protein n=1 Tax=Treponema pectinovorum TaxID=164 RepID=UPI0011C7697F|nr:recombinase family protein [Treponema pectinovorum]
MIYGYIRVSTDGQTVENQKLAIKNYCRVRRLRKIQWISETISGTKKPEKRKLGNLLNQAQENDTIVVTELSRLGRSLMMILNVLQNLLDKKVKVIAIKEGYELGDNIQSKVLAFAFGLSAEIERTLLSERTKQGLERARKNGKQIGRLPGQKPNHYKLTPYRYKIKRWLKEGRSKLSIARECGVTWSTLNRFVQERLNEKPPKPLTEKPKKHGHPTILEKQWFKKNKDLNTF